MTKAVLSLVFAFTGYSIHAIAQAGQKIGLAASRTHRVRGLCLWLGATLSMPASALLVLYAVSLGNVSLVGVMSGSGLASLVLFSHLVMRERIERREIIGVAMVFAAAALIGAFAGDVQQVESTHPGLYFYLASVCAAYLLTWLVVRKRERLAGIVIAGLSGALSGFVPLLQKLSTSSFARARSLIRLHLKSDRALAVAAEKAAELLSNPWALAWIAISLLSMIVMQFAYRRDKAIRLIPSFAANTIAIPVLGGVLVFGERLHPLQWLGVFLIASGVFLITVKPKVTVLSAGGTRKGGQHTGSG
jgi:drug/metabolite transporter (DMT)-like permease